MVVVVAHVCARACVSVRWAFVCNHVRQAVMNGVFETERSVEFLGLDQIGNRKTNIPWTPPPLTTPVPFSLSASPTPGLLASGAVQPVWDNVTVYSRSGPHTLTQALGRAGGGGCGGWWGDMQRVWGRWGGASQPQ